MKRLLCAVGPVAALFLLVGCGTSDSSAPGLKDAGPLIAHFAEAGKALDGLGAAVAERPDETAPGTFREHLRVLGERAYALLQRAEPTGPSGAAAIQKELATVASDVVRHLATAEGATQDGPSKLLAPPPQPVGFSINVPAQTRETDRSERGKNTARQSLKGALSLEIEHFIYTALLANPSSREKLCSRCTPDDLPSTVDPALNMPFETTDEWRRLLFDQSNHLVVPSPGDESWTAFQGWTRAVNRILLDAVDPLRQAAFDTLYL